MTTFFSNLWCHLISPHSAEAQFQLSVEFMCEDKCLLTKHAECTSCHSWLLYWSCWQGPRIRVTNTKFWKELHLHDINKFADKVSEEPRVDRLLQQSDTKNIDIYWRDWSQLGPLLASCTLPWEAEKALVLSRLFSNSWNTGVL